MKKKWTKEESRKYFNRVLRSFYKTHEFWTYFSLIILLFLVFGLLHLVVDFEELKTIVILLEIALLLTIFDIILNKIDALAYKTYLKEKDNE